MSISHWKLQLSGIQLTNSAVTGLVAPVVVAIQKQMYCILPADLRVLHLGLETDKDLST